MRITFSDLELSDKECGLVSRFFVDLDFLKHFSSGLGFCVERGALRLTPELYWFTWVLSE